MEQLASLNSLDEMETKEKIFSHIFETYYKRIYNYIYYRVNCNYTAEDLTSQVFEKILLKIDTFKESKAPFEVWMFAIARNVVNDYFRSIKKHRFFSLDNIMELFSRDKNPEDMTITAETNDNLMRSLKTLSLREQNIIALKFGGNLKNIEIAEILNISESNVGVILYRTMKKLKLQLEREE